MTDQDIRYKIAQDFKYEGEDWQSLWLWIEGSRPELDAIDHVIYTLHATSPKPVRRVSDRTSKFLLKTEGWGTFTNYTKFVLKINTGIDLQRELYLQFPKVNQNIE